MTLQWSSVQPTEPGYYWVHRTDTDVVTVVRMGSDGNCITLGSDKGLAAKDVDLWSWPVEVPPAPDRSGPQRIVETVTLSSPFAPAAKETPDDNPPVSPPASA